MWPLSKNESLGYPSRRGVGRYGSNRCPANAVDVCDTMSDAAPSEVFGTAAPLGYARAARNAPPPTCPVCAGSDFAPLFRSYRTVPEPAPVTSDPYHVTYSSRRLIRLIVCCRGCGLGILPGPSRGDVTATYADGADAMYVLQAEERIRNAHRLLRLVPRGGRLLDVGCACGFLLVAARERGFSVQGVELSAWAAEYARREFGLSVWQGSLEDAPLEPGTWDVVVMADVIEHLDDPRAALAKIHQLLVPGGRVLILTPDLGSLAARVAGAHWWGLLDDHYHYFTRSALRRLLETEGFAVQRVVALDREFSVGYWVYKLSQYSPRLQRAGAALTRMLHLYRLRVPVNLGDQMACIAQKRPQP